MSQSGEHVVVLCFADISRLLAHCVTVPSHETTDFSLTHTHRCCLIVCHCKVEAEKAEAAAAAAAEAEAAAAAAAEAEEQAGQEEGEE